LRREAEVIAFDAAHAAVHRPPDRRFRIWVRPSILVGLALVVAAAVLAAWLQALFLGLPPVPHVPLTRPDDFAGPHGFPVWVRYAHFCNFLFVTMLVRSGLSILADHPRLYFNDHCTPGSEWLRITPLAVPRDGLWTAKDDARYISPWVALPGYRHTIGIARAWHFIDVYGFVLTGAYFVVMLFATEQWRRIVPTSPEVLPQAWSTFVHYVTLHLPPEPDGFYGYNALQQLAYFVAVFGLGPTAIASGIAMSPAVVSRYPWYARLFGGRQAARSIHFLNMLGFVGFLVVHVTLVVLTGFVRNMNHIVMGTNDPVSRAGAGWGFVGIAVVILAWIVAHHVSWRHPRLLQHAQRMVQYPLLLSTLDRLAPRQHYGEERISPYLWPNGKLPVRQDWKDLARDGFRAYRLEIGGRVERPASLSLEELAALGTVDVTSMHHCIQGWSGIARWTGTPMKALVERVKPLPGARVVAFFSFGEGLYGGVYYETQRLDNVLKPECILATHRNGQPLDEVYGAPLRLRVENQLGFKMVKWIERIEFVASERDVGAGEGGKNEDDEYFDLLPNI
jgi:DMSO/TMAO reductase YedYZ molybdopterin-dependent catalytic subunit/thiosulfate reductase cytochrome b subunit